MKRYRLFYLSLILCLGVATLTSCGSSKKVVYFQDLKPGETEIQLPEVKAITVRPEDKISIIVNSRDPQLTDLFNLPYVSRQLGQSLSRNGITTGTSQGVSVYTVNAEGEIDFPVLGKIKVAGMKRDSRMIASCVESGGVWQAKRISGRTGQEMFLTGFVGAMRYQGDFRPFLEPLRYLPYVNLGRFNVFGCGWCTIQFLDNQ